MNKLLLTILFIIFFNISVSAKPLILECGEMTGISTLFENREINTSKDSLKGSSKLKLDFKTGEFKLIREGFNNFSEDLNIINYNEYGFVFYSTHKEVTKIFNLFSMSDNLYFLVMTEHQSQLLTNIPQARTLRAICKSPT